MSFIDVFILGSLNIFVTFFPIQMQFYRSCNFAFYEKGGEILKDVLIYGTFQLMLILAYLACFGLVNMVELLG